LIGMSLLQLQKRSMAIAGVAMLGYLVFHMLTNLSFFSQSAFTQFYEGYNIGLIRWPILLIFAGAVVFHVKTAIKIRKVNSKARTVDYQIHDKLMISAALVTASIGFLLFFIIVHILQTVTFDTDHVYQELSGLFQSVWMLVFYMAGLFVMTMHLSHSLANVLQTLGKTSVSCHYLVWAACILLGLGFAIVPLYIFFVMS